MTHHPSEAVLADYAAGALRPAFGAVVAAHLERCPRCREAVAALETAGLALIETLPAEAAPDAWLDAAMAALDEAEAPAAARPAPTEQRIPFGPAWPLAPGMSIRKARIGDDGGLLYLLRLPAGIRTLPHGHRGIEFTTVLKGAYQDDGETFAAGDFCEMNPSVDHQPMVTGDSECVCLIASERPMRMDTWMGRMVQALTGV